MARSFELGRPYFFPERRANGQTPVRKFQIKKKSSFIGCSFSLIFKLCNYLVLEVWSFLPPAFVPV